HDRRQRLPADAVPLRALRPEPDLCPVLRLAADRPAHRRPGRYHRRWRVRFPVPRTHGRELRAGHSPRVACARPARIAQCHALQGNGRAAVLAPVGTSLRPALSPPDRAHLRLLRPHRQEITRMFEMTRLHGATVQHDGATCFSLWAPDADTVAVKLGDGSVHTMHHQASGWYSARVNCGPGSTYRFLINGQLSVPDPASRYQPQGVDGPSCVLDPDAFAWQFNEWKGRPWHETVIYELHPGACGGFAGIQARLPELVDLGITAIELMPVNECPGKQNWGYDGVFPFAPQSTCGTPDDLRRLIDAAHGYGLMVFMDVVYNHFGPHGNYLGEYAKSFFRDDIHTPWGPAIDFRNSQVCDFFCENALMWVLDYRIDGLRLDAVHAISEMDFLTNLAKRVRSAVPDGRHVHLMLENENNQASLLAEGFDAQWNDDGHHALHVLLTGERESYYQDFAADTTIKLARCLKEGFIYQGETTRTGASRGEPSGHLPPTAFILFLQNHDQIGNRAFGDRLITLADHRGVRAALGLVLLCPMIPMLFMGEEW